MTDLWGFLLQTLTASGAAVLLLVIKALFKDKLPPRWQFAVWGVLGLVLLIPAGHHGRYLLFRWQTLLELLKSRCGDYSFIRVYFPFPWIGDMPQTVTEWLFAVYVLGVLLHVIKYTVSYFKLRLLLRNGTMPPAATMEKLKVIAERQKVKLCRVVGIQGLSGAFICGVIRPILVVPAETESDEKVLLHELLHLKHRDTLWSIVICFFRCLHWCNPLLVYCANVAANDLETRCDQRVLELLEGEERRDYGRILLSMVNERFSKTPGSTCLNNGGKNIRTRIEAIARFKKYPLGMRMVSVCAILLLSLFLTVGVQATEFREINSSIPLSLASARSIPCTTYAGAFDTYGKAILDQNGYYRAMCMPMNMQERLEEELLERERVGLYPEWDPGLPAWPKMGNYYIYNLKQCDDGTYEGLFVVELNYPPNGEAAELNMSYLAVQTLRAEKENGRWVIIPMEEFRAVKSLSTSLAWGCRELPGIFYTGTVSDIQIDVQVQTIHRVDNRTQENGTYFDTKPKPNARFDFATIAQNQRCTHRGTEVERDCITHIGLSVAPVYTGEKRPDNLSVATGATYWRSSNTGEDVSSQNLKQGWNPVMEMGGGGTTIEPDRAAVYPEYYAADLYLNQKLSAKIELIRQKGE